MRRLSTFAAAVLLFSCSSDGTRLLGPHGSDSGGASSGADAASGGAPDGSTASGGVATSGGAGSGGVTSSGGASMNASGATGNAGSGGRTAGTGGGASGNGGSTAANARAFKLATTGAQLLVTGPDLGLQLTQANVATDADVIAVHQEFYGVPWHELEAGQPPPAEWTLRMQSLASAARAAKRPVFLSVTMLNGARERLAATTTIDNGQVKTRDDTSGTCYDFATAADAASKRAAYLRYVELMVDTFSPAYLNIAVEVNLFFEKCAAAAPALRSVINAAYDAAKTRSPSTLVFPSIQIDHLYGYSKDSCPNASDRAACFDAAYATLAGLKRDRFAMSTYPFLSEIGDPASLPPDWFTRGAARGKETPLIAETGWLSTSLIAKAMNGTCSTVRDDTEARTAAYLARVLGDADKDGLDLVTWWSDRDLLPVSVMTDCPCHLDATWCSVVDVFRGPSVPGSTVDTQFFGEVLMKAFGTMGLRLYDGSPKPTTYPLWSAALARPLSR